MPKLSKVCRQIAEGLQAAHERGFAASTCHDISGDEVRFAETRAENPDLDAVARLIEYAKSRDLPAVRAYTTDDKTAASVLQRMPSSDQFFSYLDVIPAGPDEETVLLGFGKGWRFELVKIYGRWLISDFRISP